MPAQLSVGRRRRLVAVVLAAVMALAMVGCGGGGDNEAKLGQDADIIIDNMGFQPKEFEARVGQEVTVSVLNRDDRNHTFTLTLLGINQEIPAGKRVDVRLKIDQRPRDGFFSFYSDPYQSEGYAGKIIVKG